MRTESFRPDIRKPQGPEISFSLGQLSKAAESGDTENIQLLIERLAQEFPDQLEIIQAIADLPRYLDVCTQLDIHAEKGKQRQKLIREKAEFHFLLTHLVCSIQDRKILAHVWNAMDRIAQAQKKTREYVYGRAGILSQVATYKIFQQLGLHPELSHPSEDQYNAVDLWQESSPVQVKSGKDDKPLLVKVDRLGPTHIAIQGEEGQQRIGNWVLQDIEHFTAGLQAYEKSTGQHVTGYLLELPKSSYDKVTGQPSEDIVQFVRKQLGLQMEEEKAA